MEIINKVTQSGIRTIDLEELFTPGERVLVDLKPWLFEEIILKEKDFREHLKTHDWSEYTGKHVAITCTADAIVPTWAYMLIASALQTYARTIITGDLEQLEIHLFNNAIYDTIHPIEFKDQRVVIKGCSKVHVPLAAYVTLTSLLRPVVKSIMYGEPCSTVPVFKRKD